MQAGKVHLLRRLAAACQRGCRRAGQDGAEEPAATPGARTVRAARRHASGRTESREQDRSATLARGAKGPAQHTQAGCGGQLLCLMHAHRSRAENHGKCPSSRHSEAMASCDQRVALAVRRFRPKRERDRTRGGLPCSTLPICLTCAAMALPGRPPGTKRALWLQIADVGRLPRASGLFLRGMKGPGRLSVPRKWFVAHRRCTKVCGGATAQLRTALRARRSQQTRTPGRNVLWRFFS